MEPGTAIFGYTVCKSMPDGSQIGAVLVTDIYGLPVEFRHTDPVIPTKLQRVLYGRSLDAYIANEVLVGALLSSVTSSPQLYISGDSTYVDGASEFGAASAWLAESRAAQEKGTGHKHDIGPAEFILQLGPGSGAVRVKVGSPRSGSSVEQTKAASELASRLLLQASQNMEVLEPLERVDEAIQLVFDDLQQKRAHAALLSGQPDKHPRKAA